jgi:hypothetical protein
MGIKYKEELSFNIGLSALLLFPIIIIAALIIMDFGLVLSDTTSFFVAIELFLIIVFWNFRKLRIIITDEFLEFGFGIFNKRFNRKEIISCKPVEIRFGHSYFGIGIRFGWNNTILYNTRFGKAVRIKVRGHQRDFVVTSDNPKKLCNVLRE